MFFLFVRFLRRDQFLKHIVILSAKEIHTCMLVFLFFFFSLFHFFFSSYFSFFSRFILSSYFLFIFLYLHLSFSQSLSAPFSSVLYVFLFIPPLALLSTTWNKKRVNTLRRRLRVHRRLARNQIPPHHYHHRDGHQRRGCENTDTRE